MAGSSDDGGLDETPEKRASKAPRAGGTRKRAVTFQTLESPVKQKVVKRAPEEFVFNPLGSRGGGPSRETPPETPPPPDGTANPAKSSPATDLDEDGELPDYNPCEDMGLGAAGGSRRNPSARPGQEDRRHAEEENWASTRASSRRIYVESCPGRERVLRHQMEASRAVLQRQVDQVPRCEGCNLSDGSCLVKDSSQPVLYVSQQFRFLLEVPIFACSASQKKVHAHPLAAHAFPGTAVWGFQLDAVRGLQGQPVWYALDLLELYDSLVFNGKRGGVSVESFCNAVERLHEKHGCVEPSFSSDSFRKGFGKASEEMGYVWHGVHDMASFGVEHFEAGPFSTCAACQVAGITEEASQVLHSVYVDACFKIKHLARAGQASAHRQQHISDTTFIADDVVKGFLDIKENAVDAGESTCSEFKADSVYGTAKQSIYDVSGYIGVFCRHGILGIGANVFGGERYGLATLLLLTLIAVYKIPLRFCWYDIGCRYKVHLAAWLALQTASSFALAGQAIPFHVAMQLARAIVSVVPPFHQYAHSASCQAENSGKHAVGAGRAAGEPPENAWAFFGTFNRLLQHRSLAGRADFMARLRGCWNEQKAAGLPELLVRMHVKAKLQVETSRMAIQDVNEKATRAGVALDQVVLGADSHVELVEPTRAWVLDYVMGLLQQRKLDSEAANPLPSLDILFSHQSGGFQKLTRDSPFSKQLARKLISLETKHAQEIGRDAAGQPVRWDISCASFQEAYKLLRLTEMQRLQRQIESQVHDLLYLQTCARRLGDRPGDLKKVRRDMERGKERVKVALHRLKQWGIELTVKVLGEQAECDTGKTSLGSTIGAAVAARFDAVLIKGWRLEDVLQAKFAWRDEGADLSGGYGSEGLRLKRQLVSLVEDEARGKEELELVEGEMVATLQRYTKQTCSLASAIATLRGIDLGSEESGRARSYRVGQVFIMNRKRETLERLLSRAKSLFEGVKRAHQLDSGEVGSAVRDHPIGKASEFLESDVESEDEPVEDDFD